MAQHEVPFTQFDLLMLLTGDLKKGYLGDLFCQAAHAQILSIENITGRQFNTSELCTALAEDGSNSFFQVPKYLYDAWISCTDRPLFRGMKIKPWHREFIVLQPNMDELQASKLGKSLTE